jgi:SpoVK/Ycf46/Vps4 family AAA+-type ATPase
MPTVDHLLDLFEAVHRKDWTDLKEVAYQVADHERSKKHYSAANKIREAVDHLVSNLTTNEYMTTSNASSNSSAPIDLLRQEDTNNFADPILPSWIRSELSTFLKEWELKEELNKQNLYPRNTLLFHGLPGCGKTLLAKYIAKKMGMKIYTLQFDALISSYLGETGANIKQVFDFASLNKCILFIDEIDAIAKLRDDKSELGELKRVVITLLQNIDSFPKDSILIAATNHAHMLDAAIWRRFDISWKIQPPKDEVRMEFFRQYMQNQLDDDKLQLSLLNITKGMSGSEIIKSIDNARKRVFISSNTEMVEAIFLSILEHLKRNEDTKNKKYKSSIVEVVNYLRSNYKKKYTYSELEDLTGISHSTLHHKVKASSNA